MGKLTISMAMFNSFLYVYQRVSQTLSQWLLTPRYDSQWSTSWDDPPSGPYVIHVVHVGIEPWMLWCRHCKGQHALFPGQHWRGGLAVAAKKPPAGCFSPWKPWIFESKSISWINLWFCEVKYHFFWGGTWAVSGKFGVVVGIMFENSVSWPSVWVLQHCGGELEEALAGHSEGTLSWMCHEQLMIVAVQDNWNCSYMSMVHCFRRGRLLYYIIILLYYINIIILYCIVLYYIILYYVLYIYIYYWVYWSDLNCTTWLSEGAVQILDLFFQWLLQNGSLTSVGFVSQLQGFVPNYIYIWW